MDWQLSPVARWLILNGHRYSSISELMDALCHKLVEHGVPLWRASWGIRTIHPQVRGSTYVWQRNLAGVTKTLRPHEIEQSKDYIDSPFRMIFEGLGPLRWRLEKGETEFPILREIRDQGGTDYFLLPLSFDAAWVNAMAWASDRKGGFAEEDIAVIQNLAPILAPLIQVRTQRRVVDTLLSTYLGRNAAARLQEGRVKRGDGDTITAVLMATDLVGFTTMAETEPSAHVIAALNDYFEQMTYAVHHHEGDVLKFVGDGMLAIFSIGGETSVEIACERAVSASTEAVRLMDQLNSTRVARALNPLEYGLALHVGEVVYGNIGAPDRLDFTTIGPAVNRVARIEALSHGTGERILVSKAFAVASGCPSHSLGYHQLPGIPEPQEVFALELVP